MANAATLAGLTPAQLRDYRQQGFLILRGLFSAEEMGAVAAEADRLCGRTDLIHSDNLRCRWQPHVQTGECLFETFDPVIDLSPLCATLARDERLLAALASLYDEPAHLFKDKLILKPPGAKGYDLHQDFTGWPGFPRSFVTALVAVDASDRHNGCTEVFAGYHTRGYLSPEDGQYHPLPPGTVQGDGAFLELEPGDVALFGCFTPHRSAPNASGRWRRALYLSYNADSDGGDRRDRHYQEFHAWLRERYAEYGKHGVWFR